MSILEQFILNLAAIQVFISESAVLHKPKNFIASLGWTDTLFFCTCSQKLSDKQETSSVGFFFIFLRQFFSVKKGDKFSKKKYCRLAFSLD